MQALSRHAGILGMQIRKGQSKLAPPYALRAMCSLFIDKDKVGSKVMHVLNMLHTAFPPSGCVFRCFIYDSRIIANLGLFGLNSLHIKGPPLHREETSWSGSAGVARADVPVGPGVLFQLDCAVQPSQAVRSALPGKLASPP